MKTLLRCILILLACTACLVTAQVITANLAGTVSDTTGGRVANARVTATNMDTGFSRQVTTGPEGTYVLPFLPVGRYSLKIEAPGFKNFVQEPIELSVNQVATVEAQISVGQTSDTVTVAADANQLTTDTSQIGGVVDSKRLVELPLNGRNVLQFVQLMPGAALVSAPQAFATARFGPTLVINGSRSNENGIYLDGGLYMDLFRGTALNLPPPDQVQEFRAITAGFSAEYGRVPGSIINAVTKSGTNDLHGNLYEFFRNDALNSRRFFDARVPKLKQNQFGGTIGGPVVKNKLFFFFGYQGLRVRPEAAATSAFLPSAQEKQGIFTTPIKNPATGLPFSNNTIPKELIDKVSANIQSMYIPTATVPGQPQFIALPAPENNNIYTGKGDYQINDKNRLFGRYNTWKTVDLSAAARSTNVPGFSPNFNGTTVQDYVAGLTSTLTPTFVNEFRAGYHRTNNSAGNDNHTDLAALGANFPSVKNPPFVEITNTGYSIELEPQVTTNSIGNIYQASDDMSYTKGRHQLRFGVQAWQYRSLYRCDYLSYSYAGFTGDITGNAYADFLLGRPNSFSTNEPTFDLAVNSTIVGSYIQDDWRVTPRVTVNLGLRYEIQTPWYSPIKNLSQVRPGVQSTRFPTAPIGMVYEGDPGVPKGFINLDKNNFAPRVGLAWDVFGNAKTVIRAGAGIFTGQINSNHFAFANSQPFNISRNLTNVVSYSDPLRGQPSILPDLKTFFLPISPTFIDPNVVNPYTMSFNFQVGQQLARDLTLEVAYVGKLGRKLMQALDFDPALPGVDRNYEARRVFMPGVYTLGIVGASRANSSYHSLQTQVIKRYSHGITGSFAYTFSKLIDVITSNVENDVNSNPFFWDSDRARSDNDRTHVAAASLVWEFPKSGSSNAFMKTAVDGWQLSPIITARSGQPVNFTNGTDRAGVNSNRTSRQRPNIVGNPIISGDRSKQDTLLNYFNKAAFQQPALGTFGNVGRNIWDGPGFFQLDLGVYKNFAIRERSRLQFRSEFFNLTNRANFNNPNTTISSGSFGRITGTQPGRVIQFALKLGF
jgi:hypothetical protein